jgi:hypothetical protein
MKLTKCCAVFVWQQCESCIAAIIIVTNGRNGPDSSLPTEWRTAGLSAQQTFNMSFDAAVQRTAATSRNAVIALYPTNVRYREKSSSASLVVYGS